MNLGLKVLIKRQGPSFDTRQQRAAKAALSLIGIAFSEVKEDLEHPRHLIISFLYESEVKM